MDEVLRARAAAWSFMKAWERRELAHSLRRTGLSYREMSEIIPVGKGTLSIWCRDVPLTEEQLAELGRRARRGCPGHHRGAQANRRKREMQVAAIRQGALAEVHRLATSPLWIAGVMLYWAEGSKTKHVCMTNSDPNMVALTMRWFRESLDLADDRFRARMHLHTGQDEVETRQHWARVTGLDETVFGKTHWKKEGTGHRKNVLYRGTLQIVVTRSGDLLHRLKAWTEGCYDPVSGPLAKLVSHRTLNPQIPGSSPGGPTR